MKIDLEKLAKFLVEAKKATYAGEGGKVVAQRTGFDEMEFRSGDWKYRDSYAGFFAAPGQEVVYFRGKPIWAMAYSGGMVKKHHGDVDFALRTFGFLKRALKKATINEPFRGPKELAIGDFVYKNMVKGDIGCFIGLETITYKGKVVFRQDYMGGLIVHR